jgi:hypothetical protein
MPNDDATYQRLTRLQVRYAALMGILSLVMGLIYREFARPFFEGIPLEQQLTYSHVMEQVHGHTFLVGAAVPAVMALLTFLVLGNLDAKVLGKMLLRFKVYIISSAVTVALMLYKGLAFVAGAGQPLDAIDAALFFGSRWFRASLFGLAHVVLFWAAGEYLFHVFRAAKAPGEA